jgi:hypothetical protein
MVDAGCWRHTTFVLDASVSSFVPETAFHEWPSLKLPRTRRPNLQSAPRQRSEAVRALISRELSGFGRDRVRFL